MELCLLDVTTKEVKEKVEKSDFVCIIIDETLNCTLDNNNKMIKNACVENNCVLETIFLGNNMIHDRTDECVFEMFV